MTDSASAYAAEDREREYNAKRPVPVVAPGAGAPVPDTFTAGSRNYGDVQIEDLSPEQRKAVLASNRARLTADGYVFAAGPGAPAAQETVPAEVALRLMAADSHAGTTVPDYDAMARAILSTYTLTKKETPC